MTGGLKVFIWQLGRYGAGPRIAFELAAALEKKCDMEVFLSLAEGAELLETNMCREAAGIRVKTYNTTGQFAARTLMIHKHLGPLIRRLEQERPDVALSVMPGYWDIFVIRQLRRLGIPVITIIHDAVNHPGDRFQLIQWIQGRMIGHSTAVITLTDFVARCLRGQGRLGNKKHWTISHPALIFPDLKLMPPQQPDYTLARPLRLLLTGRLRTYKGGRLFLEAISKIDPARLHVRIAGAVNDQALLDRAKELPHVDMQNGWLSEKTFVSHIDWADTVILPYTEASQSGIIPTAYARRRPVIVTPVGGLPEQVRHEVTGLIAPNVSPEAIAQAILRFLDTPELLKSCADNAYFYAQEELSWEQIGNRIAGILSEVGTSVSFQSERENKPTTVKGDCC